MAMINFRNIGRSRFQAQAGSGAPGGSGSGTDPNQALARAAERKTGPGGLPSEVTAPISTGSTAGFGEPEPQQLVNATPEQVKAAVDEAYKDSDSVSALVAQLGLPQNYAEGTEDKGKQKVIAALNKNDSVIQQVNTIVADAKASGIVMAAEEVLGALAEKIVAKTNVAEVVTTSQANPDNQQTAELLAQANTAIQKIQASINKAQEALNHTATATSQNQITNGIAEAQTALSATQSIIKKIQITYDSTDKPNTDSPQPNAEQIDTSASISTPLQTTDFTITLPSQQAQKTTATNEEDCAQHTSIQVVTTPNSYLQLLYKNLTDPNFTCLSLFIPLFLLYLLIKKVIQKYRRKTVGR